MRDPVHGGEWRRFLGDRRRQAPTLQILENETSKAFKMAPLVGRGGFAAGVVLRSSSGLGVPLCGTPIVVLRLLTPHTQPETPGTLRLPGLLVGRGGFEPPLTGPEPVVLPLDDLPRVAVDSKRAARGSQDSLVYPKRESYNPPMTQTIRAPIVAGAFYPGDPIQLRATVDTLFGDGFRPATDALPRSVGLIAPHAGYLYSGRVAASGYRRVAELGRPDLVLLLGANHTGSGEAMSLPDEDAWSTPLGCSPIERSLVLRLQALGIPISSVAHEREHSIEVHLPFIQVLWGFDVPILPICVMPIALSAMHAEIDAIAGCVEDAAVLVVASSDFTHYEPDTAARARDRLALQWLEAFDAERFEQTYRDQRLSICGAGPILALLALGRRLGLAKGELVQYATSGDVTGDRTAVVGYAAVLFSMEGS